MKMFHDFKGLRIEVGDGQRIRLWEYPWCGFHLCSGFPAVFSPIADSAALVLDYGELIQVAAVWNPTLRRPAFDWEVGDIAALLWRLDPMGLVPGQVDKEVWVAALLGSSVSSLAWIALIARSPFKSHGRTFGTCQFPTRSSFSCGLQPWGKSRPLTS